MTHVTNCLNHIIITGFGAGIGVGSVSSIGGTRIEEGVVGSIGESSTKFGVGVIVINGKMFSGVEVGSGVSITIGGGAG